ncbi:MAG: hypothetical protein JSW02_02730 [candidate division WOR-3 bacterium]|nr:MAG: hypothetical protein JSW02_02730 [candidate division WOR-3 bacterium]
MKSFYWLLVCVVILAGMSACNGKKEDTGTKTNTPPSITNIILEPQTPTIRTEISARIISVDKENDPISYDIKWFVNGQQIGEGMLFSYEDIRKGDMIFAEATPYDGKDWGEPVRTGEITVGGLPPRILSVQIAPESVFVTTPRIAATALAEDPDRDSVSIIVHWVIGDEVIPDTSHIIDLRSYGLKKHDVITGSAFVDDGEYRSEPFTFEVHIANAPPVLTNQIDSVKCKPESLYYKLPIMDPDNDPLNYELLDAPAGIMIDPTNGVVYGNAGAATEFTIEVRAADNDGAYLDYRFTITTPQM